MQSMSDKKPIQIKIDKSVFNDSFYPYLFDYSNRFEVYRGGAGSGKSHFVSQKLIIKAMNDPGRRIMICRRTSATIIQTVWEMFLQNLRFFQLLDHCYINKTNRIIELPNGSQLIFMGLDDEYKLLSLTDIADVFVEEVFEVPKAIVDQLNLRLRGSKKNKQIYLAFNPISKAHWLYDFCEGETKPSSMLYHLSTYKDNKFLDDEYIQQIEEQQRTNPHNYRIYALNQWGVASEAIVFPNHRTEDFDINEMLKNKELEVKIGMDLGFVDASTCAVTLWDKQNKKIYIISEYYEERATLDEVFSGVKALGVGKLPIYVDSAEPRSIQYFQSLGLNAKPSKKSNGSNELYIQFLQNHEIIIHSSCVHAQEDFDNFCYAKNKMSGELEEGKYTHEYSHLIDAVKYAYSDVYRNKKLKSFDWKLL